MAILINTTTSEADKNFWGTTWRCFDDGQDIFEKYTGKRFVLDVAATNHTAKVDRFYTSLEWLENRAGNDHHAGAGFNTSDFTGSNDRNPNPSLVGFDALSLPWEDGWWCNPPFDLKLDFIRKATIEAAKGHDGLMLVPYEPCTNWFVDEVEGFAKAAFEPDGRYQFLKPDGVTPKTGANFPVTFLLFSYRGIETPRIRMYRTMGRR